MNILHKCITLSTFAILPSGLVGQISHGGTPYSFSDEEVAPRYFERMPMVDNQAMLARDAGEELTKNKPFRFGEKADVDLGLDNSGTWHTLGNGNQLWTLGIRSEGAKTINLIFSEYELPPGATVFIYNEGHSDFIGALNHTNNKPHGKLGTRLLEGEAVIIEYYEPKSVRGQGRLRVGSVTHGYRDILSSLDRAYGDADACTININCPEGANWQVQSRASVMLMVGGSGFCSGTLVNNTSNDGTPYVLTAEHCVGGDDGSTWVYLFNWEAPTCTNANPGMNNTVSGSIIRSSMDDNTTDFALFELSSVPPANYNAIYSGWTRSATEPQRYIGISHPSADIKKWNEETPQGRDSSYWLTSPAWNLGQTEFGSSGCGVWDQNGLLVGQLWGGSGWCNDTNLINYWGRFDKSWEGGGSASTRLKDWLDPSGSDDDWVDHLDPSTNNIEDVAAQGVGLKAYPNPAMNQVIIEVDNNTPTQYFLYSNVGQLVRSGSISGTATVDLSCLSNGIYELRVSNSFARIIKSE